MFFVLYPPWFFDMFTLLYCFYLKVKTIAEANICKNMVKLIKKCCCYFICRGMGLLKPSAVYGNVYISFCAFRASGKGRFLSAPFHRKPR